MHSKQGLDARGVAVGTEQSVGFGKAAMDLQGVVEVALKRSVDKRTELGGIGVANDRYDSFGSQGEQLEGDGIVAAEDFKAGGGMVDDFLTSSMRHPN